MIGLLQEMTYKLTVSHEDGSDIAGDWAVSVDGPQISVMVRGDVRLTTIANALRAMADAIENCGGGHYGGGSGGGGKSPSENVQLPPAVSVPSLELMVKAP